MSYNKLYYQNNRNKFAEWQRKYLKKNYYKLKNKRNAYSKNYYEKNTEKLREESKKRYANNPEKCRLMSKNWRMANKQKTKNFPSSKPQYHIQWREKNKEKWKLIYKRFYRNNRQKILLYSKQVNHSRRKNAGLLDKETLQKVYERNIIKFKTLTCELCFTSIRFGEDSLEHFNPISRGGTNELSNLGIAHRICNRKKWNKTLDQFKKLTEV